MTFTTGAGRGKLEIDEADAETKGRVEVYKTLEQVLLLCTRAYSFPQTTSKLPIHPVFMLPCVLWESSYRNSIMIGAAEQETTQTEEMSTNTTDRHMHTCPEAVCAYMSRCKMYSVCQETKLSGAYQQRGTQRRTSAD